MKVNNLINIIETIAPREMACDWDNTGFQVGRWDAEVTGIYVALDATEKVISAAIDAGCSFLLTHHPLIFKGVKAGSNGISDLKPLCFDMNAREKYEDYWNAFFVDKGEWTKYASLQDKRVGSTRYLRDGRQMVETVTVTVDRAGLKKKLQEDGIIPKEGRY